MDFTVKVVGIHQTDSVMTHAALEVKQVTTATPTFSSLWFPAKDDSH